MTKVSPQNKKPLNPFVMVLLGFAGAVVLGEVAKYAFDFHSHQCTSCSYSWQHFGAFNFGDEGSHTCPRCGQVQWWKCGAPSVQQAPQREPPLAVEPPLLEQPLQMATGAPLPAPMFRSRW